VEQSAELRGTVWQRNLQLRLVTITVAISVLVIGLVGFILLNRVTAGLLRAKESSSLSEATAARQEVQRLVNASDTGIAAPNATRLVDSVITALAVRAGSPGLYDALLLSDKATSGTPERGTQYVTVASIPQSMRDAVKSHNQQAWMYSAIHYEDGSSTSGIIVGAPVIFPGVGDYELYLLFPLKNEQNTVNLVRRGVLGTGIALLIGLGVLAWFVTSRVADPVREAAHVAERLAAGDFNRRMSVRGKDDMARLAGSFNEMAESLQSQITRLEALSQIQQKFVSDVSHELRTPLTTVRMASEMIYDARRDFDPDTARSAELLRRQVDRFDSLLTELLEMSRFDAGVAELDATTVDVVALVQGVTEQYADVATSHETRFNLDIPSTYVMVEGDSRRLSRIVRNLLTNAIEYSESKPIDITIASNDEAVSIGVRDHGQGLNSEDLELVFGRFWRADPARQRTLGGTGLGLAISVEDAHLHGGFIHVAGQSGLGAHFVLTVPRRIGLTDLVPAIVAEVSHA